MSGGTCCLATSVADTTPLGRMTAMARQLSGGWQAEKHGRIMFTRGLGPDISEIDKWKGFISCIGLSSKMGVIDRFV
jgi:hypothetical protein